MLMIAMNMPVEHRDVLVRRENVHHVVAIAGEPLPLRLQIEQRPVREHHNRCRLRKTSQIFSQPSQLLRSNFWLRARNIVERDEVHAAMIERVVGLLEELAIELSAVKPGIMLARY